MILLSSFGVSKNALAQETSVLKVGDQTPVAEVFQAYGNFIPATLTFASAEPPKLDIVVSDSSPYIEQQKKLAEEAARHEAEQRAAEARKRATAQTTTKASASQRPRNYNFVKGQCTDWVARHFPVTWRGNAITWAANARAQGYRVDRIPTAGAILQTNDNRKLGHVLYILKVSNGLISTSEMNYVAPFVVTYRTIPVNSPTIVAVIHRL